MLFAKLWSVVERVINNMLFERFSMAGNAKYSVKLVFVMPVGTAGLYFHNNSYSKLGICYARVFRALQAHHAQSHCRTDNLRL